MAMVVFGQKMASFLVFLSLIVKCKLANRLSHFAIGAAVRECVTSRLDPLGPIVWRFILADVFGRRDLDLIHADDGYVSKVSSAQTRHRREGLKCLGCRISKCHGRSRGRRSKEEFAPAPVSNVLHHSAILIIRGQAEFRCCLQSLR